MDTPPLKLHSNSESSVKKYLNKSLGEMDKPLPADLMEKIEALQEEARKEEEAMFKKEFESREERHEKRMKAILALVLGEEAQEEEEQTLYHPTEPEGEVE